MNAPMNHMFAAMKEATKIMLLNRETVSPANNIAERLRKAIAAAIVHIVFDLFNCVFLVIEALKIRFLSPR